ncbi:RodZ domain-containing protein [Paenibacillus sp. GCM10012306]|uniref:RodZ domain-containing protein n=1 Tax=Paenibacillus sp. GCM10012306 TaxID=3317342 RepID=UPI003621BB5A
MSELGRQLKEARLQKGMSLDDVQEVTKIRKKYLEAIEAGDYKVLPGSFYVRAFIKTYAEAVGINPDELLEEHGNVPAPPVETTPMETVIQKRSRRPETERNAKWLPTLLMWTFPVLIIAVIYMYASNLNKGESNQVDSTKVTDAQQDPATAQTPPPAAGNTAKPTATEGTASVEPTPEPTLQPTPSPTPPPPPQAVTVTEDRKSGKSTIFKVSAPPGSAVQVKIAANGVSWLEVYKGSNSKGEKLSFGNTAAGDNMTFTLDSAGMYIKSGYSPATIITVNGQQVTDGKSSSRILLELNEASGGNGTGNSGATNSESTSTQ